MIGVLAALALVGGGAAAVSLRSNHDTPEPAEYTERTTPPTAASELDVLGLTRLGPSVIVDTTTFGRMRVVPAGGPLEWDSAFEPQANLQAGEVPTRDDSNSGLSTPSGSVFDPALPVGFRIESAGSLGKRVGVTATFVSGAIRLSKSGENRPVTLEYWKLRPDAVVEVTALNGSSIWDMSARTGTTGFLQIMAPRSDFESVLNADFVVGDIYFRLRAPGASASEMLQLVSGVREELSE